MSGMIERVAKAIKWGSLKDEIASTDHTTGVVQYMRDIMALDTVVIDDHDLAVARAAIEAMREPTPEMLFVGSNDEAGFTQGNLLGSWQLMIDEALQNPPLAR